MESAAIPWLERRIAGWAGRYLIVGRRRGGPWDPPADLKSEAVAFPGNTGGVLAGRYFPRDEARGVVVCVHPDRRYAGHWFVRSGWVAFLLDAGFEVLVFDLTGYGASHGPATYYAEDVREAVLFARRWSGGLKVHVVGVSMGAHAAASASPWLSGVGALILESPPRGLMPFAKGRLNTLGVRAFPAFFPRTAAQVRADQRLAGAAVERILVAASQADEVTPAPLSAELAARGPAARTRYVEYEKVPHLHLIDLPEYRRAVLETLGAETAAGAETVIISFQERMS